MDKIAILTINEPSLNAAIKLKKHLNEFKVDIFSKTKFNKFEKLDDILEKIWKEYDAIIGLIAIGALIRKIAPFLENKSKDPAVLALNLELNRVVPLLGGHLGGANELSELLAKRLPNCINFITTATDQTNTLSFDMLAKKMGWRIQNLHMLANISNRLLNSQEVKVATYPFIFEQIENKKNLKLIDFENIDKNSVVIGFKNTTALTLRPKVFLGIGCNKNTKKEILKEAFELFLATHQLQKEDIAFVGSFEKKAQEKGLLEFIKEENLKIKFFKKEEINSLKHNFSPSASTKFFSLKGVAEPSALLLSFYKQLIFPKKAYFKSVTIAGAI